MNTLHSVLLADALEGLQTLDPKKNGKYKITDQEHLADLWDMVREILE